MVAVGRMTERQVTKAFYEKKVTLRQYQARLRKIAEKRHAKMISKTKNRRSMSATKWK